MDAKWSQASECAKFASSGCLEGKEDEEMTQHTSKMLRIDTYFPDKTDKTDSMAVSTSQGSNGKGL